MRNPLFHIVRRRDIPLWKSLLFRLAAILLGFIIVTLILWMSSGISPLTTIQSLFVGALGTERRRYTTLRATALLLCVSLALLPAFKMKFWNLGGDGQILIACLAAINCMIILGDAGWPDWAIWLVEIPVAILAGIIWAAIPAIFKAFFNTNESLFTLMLNYIASVLVGLYLTATVTNGSGVMNPVSNGTMSWKVPFPEGGNYDILPIVIAGVVLIGMFAYLRFFRHGYELAVVGESQNTAKYIGINVKKVIIRTVVLSGAICGLVGLLLATSINHTINDHSTNNIGFTAIMVTWLAKFNPFAMVGVSFLVSFINNGMNEVKTAAGITSDAIASVSVGFIYFTIIAVEFFLSYRIMLTNHKDKPAKIRAPKKEKAKKEDK